MNYGIVSQQQLENIEKVLKDDLVAIGVDCAILIDMAGNTLAKRDNGARKIDVYSLAALAAGNYASIDAMAKLVGEDEFSLLYHKGEKVSIHFTKVNDDILLVMIFDSKVSLGMLRLKSAESVKKINEIRKSTKHR